MQTHLANGALVATASAVAAVYEAYADHAPHWAGLSTEGSAGCAPTVECRWHSGAFPGTAALSGVVEHDGSRAQFVVLFNKLVNAGGFAGCPPPGVPGFDCTVGDLHYGMFPLTASWAKARGTVGSHAAS